LRDTSPDAHSTQPETASPLGQSASHIISAVLPEPTSAQQLHSLTLQQPLLTIRHLTSGATRNSL
jgi:hypothetical protein